MSGDGVNTAVIPRACGDDVGDLRSNGPNPLLNRLGDEVGSTIGADMAQDTKKDKRIRQHIDDVCRFEPPG
jgi:hypothetical protein